MTNPTGFNKIAVGEIEERDSAKPNLWKIQHNQNPTGFNNKTQMENGNISTNILSYCFRNKI